MGFTKKHKVIFANITSATQYENILIASQAFTQTVVNGFLLGTITGHDSSTTDNALGIALFKNPENQTVPTISLADGNDFFLPEKNMLRGDIFHQDAGLTRSFKFSYEIKTKRTLDPGDTMRFIAKSVAAGCNWTIAALYIYFMRS